jgi:hypothetical protein
MLRRRGVLEAIRFAAGVASDPSGVVTLWKAAGGGKAVGCLPAAAVPELLHAANLLPIAFESPEDLSLFPEPMDAWLVGADPSPFPVPSGTIPRFAFPGANPGNLEAALDRIEALAEWAGAVSGFPVSEGKLWKAVRAYASRRSLLDRLDERIARETAFLTRGERRDILRAGNFLPPETHSRLLSSILGISSDPAVLPPRGEQGDPLLFLAKRLM